MLELVCCTCRWRRILILGVVTVFLVGILFVAVMSDRPSCHRSSNESSTSCPSSHSHGRFPFDYPVHQAWSADRIVTSEIGTRQV